MLSFVKSYQALKAHRYLLTKTENKASLLSSFS